MNKIKYIVFLMGLLSFGRVDAQIVKNVSWSFKRVDWSFFGEDKNIKIDWLTPKDREMLVSGDEIEVELAINSPRKLKKEQMTIAVNWAHGMKADESDLFGDDNSFTYTSKVKLPHSINELVLQITDENGVILRKSEPRIIRKGGAKNLDNLWAYWIAPNPNKLGGKPFIQKESELFIDFNIVTPLDLTKGNISVVVNEQILNQPSREKLIKSGGNGYNYNAYVKLDESIEINRIHLTVQTPNGRVDTRQLPVRYDPIRPNLHLLSIGVPFPSLQYTTKDARDFISLFDGQGGKSGNRIFNSVESDFLIGESADALEISKAITRLKVNFDNGNIGEDDVVLLFISTHGALNSKGEFILQGKGYTPGNSRTGILYKEVISWLEDIPCKKMVFIDACHSGGGKLDPASINNEIMKWKKASGLAVLASSRNDQQSFEDAQWENGAFTEAMIDGLKYGKADNNPKNGIVTLVELYDYMSEAVPDMVKMKKGTQQNPVLITNGLGNIGIYVVNKK